MLPKINPKQMAQMMRQMGISQEQINAVEVIIRTPEHDLVISSPEVLKVNMGGQATYQISGEVEERPSGSSSSASADASQGAPRELEISDDDIQTVMDQSGATQEEAEAAIAEAEGDLAKAILSLKEDDV